MIYDQHVHSYLSFDCEEQPENYLTADTRELVLTDHFDLNNPVTAFNDDVPDFKELFAIKDRLAAENGVTLRAGVEVGYAPGLAATIKETLADQNFDVVLLSCHHNNRADYMDEAIKLVSADPVAEYFAQLLEAIAMVPEAHILAHFDYGTRIHAFTVEKLRAYEPQLVAVLEASIKKGLAFELNSKSMYRYGNYDLYAYAIPLYIGLGGTLFTLGSDAHQAGELEMEFEQSKQLLRDNGVTHVAVFRAGQAEMVAI